MSYLFRPPEPRLAERFKNTFHAGIMRFWCPLTGFKIVEFDDYIKPPDGISLAEHLRSRYGQRAKDMVIELIHRQPDFPAAPEEKGGSK